MLPFVFQKSWNCLGGPTSQGSSPTSSTGSSSSGSNNVFVQSPRTLTDQSANQNSGGGGSSLAARRFVSSYGGQYGRGSRLANIPDMEQSVHDTVRNLQYLHHQMSTPSSGGGVERGSSGISVSPGNYYSNPGLEYFQSSSGSGGGSGGGGGKYGSSASTTSSHHPPMIGTGPSATAENSIALERAARMHRNGTGMRYHFCCEYMRGQYTSRTLFYSLARSFVHLVWPASCSQYEK